MGATSCDLGRNPPSVASRVLNATTAVGVLALAFRGLNRNAPNLERPPICRLHIVDVNVQVRRHGGPILSRVAKHHDGISNPDLGVHDRTVRKIIPTQLLRSEGLPEEIDNSLGARRYQVGRDCGVS